MCADDFGLAPAVDDAILQLAHGGCLTATSCLVDGPSFAGNARHLAVAPLKPGLHLNFTESFPASTLNMPLAVLMRKAWLRQLDPVAVRREIARQLDGFEQVLGRPPDYVDGHQHVHQFPVIRDALLAELRCRYAPGYYPWLRYTGPAGLAGIPWRQRMKAYTISVLGAAPFRKLARSAGFSLNRAFLGVYDFSADEGGYARLVNTWLRNAQPGDLFMCHPATGAVPGDALGDQRALEYRVLATIACTSREQNLLC